MLVAEDMAFLWSYHAARENTAWADATDGERAAARDAAVSAFDAESGARLSEDPRGVYLNTGHVTTEALFAIAEDALAVLIGEPDDAAGDEGPGDGAEASVEQPKPRRGRPPKAKPADDPVEQEPPAEDE